MRPQVATLVILAAVAAIGCGDGEDAGTGEGQGGAPIDGVAATVEVLEFEALGSERPRGLFRASMAATAVPRGDMEIAREGDCRLLVPIPFEVCEPACDGLCVDGECRPYPTPRSAGPIEVRGARSPATLAFGEPGYDLVVHEGALLSPGGAITASAPGDEVAGFELTAIAPSAPELDFVDFLTLDASDDLTFRFAAEPDARVRVRLAAGETHGRPPNAAIECDAPDTGSLTVPRALLEPFVEPSLWGDCGRCPLSSVARYRSAIAATADGPVALLLTSELQFLSSI